MPASGRVTNRTGWMVRFMALSVVCLGLLVFQKLSVQASSGYLDTLSGGVSAILDPGVSHAADIRGTAEKLSDTEENQMMEKQ